MMHYEREATVCRLTTKGMSRRIHQRDWAQQEADRRIGS